MRSNIKFLFLSCLLIFSLSAVTMEVVLEEPPCVDDAKESSGEESPGAQPSTNKRDYSSFAGIVSVDVILLVNLESPEWKKLRTMNNKEFELRDIQQLREQFSQLKEFKFTVEIPSIRELKSRKHLLRKIGQNKEIGLIFSLLPGFIHKTRSIVLQRLDGENHSLDSAFDALEPLLFGVRDNSEFRKAIRLLRAFEGGSEVVFIDDDKEINAKLMAINEVILLANELVEGNKEQIEDWTNDYFDICFKKELSSYEPLLKSLTLQFIDLVLLDQGFFVGAYLAKARSILIRSSYPKGPGHKLIKDHPSHKVASLTRFSPKPLSNAEQTALIKKRGLPR